MGPKRNQVSYIKPNEPAFLRRIKQQAGYRDSPDVDTKREVYMNENSEDEDYLDEKEDEKPTIVVLRSGDLTAEEATKEEIELKKKEEKELIEKGKIMFKPQKKRTAQSDNSANEDVSLSKKVKVKEDSSRNEESSKKPVKKSLLSFNDDEEDE